MPSKLINHPPPPSPPSFLPVPQSEAVPWTETLESWRDMLHKLRLKHIERGRHAVDNLRVCEEDIKRIREREKGKSKAMEKIKREQDFTPSPDADDSKSSGAPSKNRVGPVPLTSSSRSSVGPRHPTVDDLKKKKKKRKRDLEDSDAEHERPRKVTPPSTHTHHPKATKTSVSSVHSHSKPPTVPDFTIPVSSSLLPPRPPVQPPPTPGPSKPTDVKDDFSKLKQPSQVLVTTFYTSIEPWIRNIKEEDIGFLEYTADEVEPYVIPKLGRHYSEVWEDEDIAIYGGPLPGFSVTRTGGNESISAAPEPKWDPSTLSERELVVEERGHGPLTERLVSALLPMPDMTVWKGVKAAEDAMEGRPGGSGAAAAKREKVNVGLLEDRIRDTMRFHGLLDSTPDYSEKVDDPIATALRQAQRELRTVVATNKARKDRLAAIARDRLGFQEYLDLRESIDKNISSTYSKLQKKDAPKLAKKKKKGLDSNGNMTVNGGTNHVPPAPHPAALGMSIDDDFGCLLSDQLRQLVDTRRQWVDTVGGVFEEKQQENPGRIWGLPKESIYIGIEDDVRRSIERSLEAIPMAAATAVSGKAGGEGKAGKETMDVR